MGSSVRNDIGTPMPPRDNKCEETYKSLQIHSANDEVLRKIKVGDELSFQIVRKAGNPSLEILYENERAGAILQFQLTNCIDQGLEYTAVVVSIDGGLCRIDANLKK